MPPIRPLRALLLAGAIASLCASELCASGASAQGGVPEPAGAAAQASPPRDGSGTPAQKAAPSEPAAQASALPRPVLPVPRGPVRTASAVLPSGLALPQPGSGPEPRSSALSGDASPELLPPPAVEAEAARLRGALAQEVPHLVPRNPVAERTLIGLLRRTLAGGDFVIDHPQLIVAVDRATVVQQLSVVLVRPTGPWEVLGTTHVSTGQAGRFDHYITPVGVFPHSDLILDYRAEGTYNENHIRGLGLKGMRVWDFGWQWAHRGWGADQSPIQIRMEMHATDPSVLAQRIGHTASQGCIRIPDAMNRFLDRHGVLDAEYERAAIDEIRYRALLLPDRVPSPLAGSVLVVVDSSGAS